MLSLRIPVHSPKPPPLPKSLRLRRPDPHPSLLGFCSDCGSWFYPRGAGLGCSPAKTRDRGQGGLESHCDFRLWRSAVGGAPRQQLGSCARDAPRVGREEVAIRDCGTGQGGPLYSQAHRPERDILGFRVTLGAALVDWGSGRLLRTQFGHPHFHPHQVRALMSWSADKPEFESVSIPPVIPSISLARNLEGLGTPKLTVAVHAPFPASPVGS